MFTPSSFNTSVDGKNMFLMKPIQHIQIFDNIKYVYSTTENVRIYWTLSGKTTINTNFVLRMNYFFTSLNVEFPVLLEYEAKTSACQVRPSPNSAALSLRLIS